MGAQGRRRDAFPVLLSSIQSAIYVWGAVIIIGLAVKIVPKEAVFPGSLFALASRTAGVVPVVTWLAVLMPLVDWRPRHRRADGPSDRPRFVRAAALPRSPAGPADPAVAAGRR
jgi:hypothetical protein